MNVIPKVSDDRVLVSFDTSDDGAVYKLTDDIAVVQSVDVLTPVVDNPLDFGRIAAANAISDIYAMGGEPRFSLSFAGFPRSVLPMSVLEQITAGAAEVAAKAGAPIIGGHTIDDPEPKFGLAVTGVVNPNAVITNNRGNAGDVLVLTKPLGSGVLTTAAKRSLAISDAELAEVVSAMATLNAGAARAMSQVGVRCATDVTGFGLLGHLSEMCEGSGVSASVAYNALPVFESAKRLGEEGVFPGGSRRNLEYVRNKVLASSSIPESGLLMMADAQTSGGMLIAVSPEKLNELMDALSANGVSTRAVIGQLEQRQSNAITVTSN